MLNLKNDRDFTLKKTARQRILRLTIVDQKKDALPLFQKEQRQFLLSSKCTIFFQFDYKETKKIKEQQIKREEN
jgi:hypothetical protein